MYNDRRDPTKGDTAHCAHGVRTGRRSVKIDLSSHCVRTAESDKTTNRERQQVKPMYSEDTTENDLRNDIAAKIRATEDPELLRELLNFITEIIGKGGETDTKTQHKAA